MSEPILPPEPETEDNPEEDQEAEDDPFLKAVARAPEAGRSVLPAPGQVLGDRYRMGERLGAGGFGTVFTAHDLELDRVVALKLLRQGEGSSLWMFKQEFRSLAGLRHPNLVRLYELHAEGERWYFTMERIPGVDLLTWGRSTPLSSPDLALLLAQVARGLVTLHRHGIVHRDIKPSNLLVTPEGRAVLLDFGLAAKSGSTGDLAGTPRYMSPELARGIVSPAADWYALGVILREILEGRNHPLNELQERLLRPDPAERAGASEVFAALGVDASEPAAPPPLFVGRRRELQALQQAFHHSRSRASVVLLRGASGVGKSALVRSLRDRLADEEQPPLWLASKCHEQESVPYKALDGAIDALFRHLHTMPGEEARKLLGAEGPELAVIFPVLMPLVQGATVPRESTPERRRRVFEGVRALYLRLLERQPLVMVVDDAHWSDLDSIALLLTLLRKPAPAGLLLLLLFREEEAARSEALQLLLRTLQTVDYAALHRMDLPVAPMPPADALELARRLFPSEAEQLAEEARGLPLLLMELARERGGSRLLDDLLRARVARLPQAGQRLLRTLAVAGVLDARVLVDAADFPGTGFDALDLLVDEGLARYRPGRRPSLELFHDRLREAILDGLDPRERRAIHRALARAFETRKPDAEALALHLEGAGEGAAAAEWALQGATAALVSLRFEQAARLLRRALDLLPTDDPRRASILARLGEALGATGHNAAAADACLAACELSHGIEQVGLRVAATEHLLTCGRLEEGIAQARKTLELLDLRFPASYGETLLALSLRLFLRVWIERDIALRPGQATPMDQMRVDTCINLSINFALFDPLRSAYFRKLALHEAIQVGEPRLVLRALLHDATTLAAQGRGVLSPREQWVRSWVNTLLPLCPGEELFVETAHAVQSYLRGDAQACLHHAECVDRGLATGRMAQRYTSMARFLLVYSLCKTGHWERFRTLFPTFLDDARARDDSFLGALLRASLGHLFALLEDRPDDAPHAVNSALTDLPGLRPTLLVGRLGASVDVALYRGRGAEAWASCGNLDLTASLILRAFRVLHIDVLWARGRALLGALSEATGALQRYNLRRQLARVEAELAAQGTPLALALAPCLRGALLPDREAILTLQQARESLLTLGLQPIALALQWHLGALTKDTHLQRQALEETRDSGVQNPGPWLWMTLPGSRTRALLHTS